jgi:hypothetical protein
MIWNVVYRSQQGSSCFLSAVLLEREVCEEELFMGSGRTVVVLYLGMLRIAGKMSEEGRVLCLESFGEKLHCECVFALLYGWGLCFCWELCSLILKF